MPSPYRTDELVNTGGPHDHTASVASVNDGKMDGFVEAAMGRRCIRARNVATCADVRPDGQPDLMAYHDEPRSRTTGRTPIGTCCRMRCSRPPTPGPCRLTSSWCRDGRRAARTDAFTCSTDLGMVDLVHELRWYEHPLLWGWTDITWLLHHHDVSWAYYAGAVLCRRPEDTREECEARGPARPQNVLTGFADVAETGQIGNMDPS